MEHRPGFAAARWGIPLFLFVALGCSAPATGSDRTGGAEPGETAESVAFHDPFARDHDRPRYGGPGELCRVEGRTACGERCVDLTSDATNCGACGTRCSEDDTCVDGHCTQITCGSGQAICNHTCCAVGDSCVNGVCTPPACPGGVPACNGTCCAATDACVNGACSANACPSGCPSAFYCAGPNTCYPMCDHASGLCGGICCPNHEWLCNGSGVCCEYSPCGDACCGQGQACQNGVCTE